MAKKHMPAASPACFFLLLAFLLSGNNAHGAGQALVGTQPFTGAPLRYSLDIFPLAAGFRKDADIAYWHGLAMGIAVQEHARLAGFSYGAAFFGLNSGAIFAGPLFNAADRTFGFSVDLLYSFVAAPVKISIQRTTAGASSGMLFSVAFAAGIGMLYPMVRIEQGQVRHLFDR